MGDNVTVLINSADTAGIQSFAAWGLNDHLATAGSTLDLSHTPGYIDIHRGYLGDANDDGTVNFSDFVALSNN